MIKLILIVSLISTVLSLDLTEQPFGHGSEVVEAVVDLIRENCILPGDNRFLRRLAYISTRDGTLPSTFSAVYFGGIWKVDEDMFLKTQKHTSKLIPLHQKIQEVFGRDWMSVTWQELVKPLYSGLAAALFIVQTMVEHSYSHVPQKIEEQATFWEHYYHSVVSAYNYTTTVNLLNKGCTANDAVDLLFIVDSSSSVNPDDLTRVKMFVSNMVDKFTISNTRTRIAFIRYSTTVTEAIGFNTVTQNSANIKTLINNIAFESGGTNTAGALDLASTTFATARSFAVKVAVLITDGKSDDIINTKHSGDRLKAGGIDIFTVGVGKLVDKAELNYVASTPVCTHTFTVENFQEIDNLVEEIEHSVCRAPLYANSTVTCQVGKCPPYAFPITSVGLTIQANISCGGGTVYSSITQQYPSKASNDLQTFIQYGNISEFYQPGNNKTNQYLYVKVDNKLIWGGNNCQVTLTPYGGQLRHTVYIFCEENGVIRNCTEEELCPNGQHSNYNPCTPKNLATGKTKFPSPGDNTKFYICDKSGKAYLTSCHVGEVFSSSCESCFGSSSGVVTDCNHSHVDSSFNGYCTPANIQAGIYYFTHPTNISLYIQCDPWGKAYVKSCLGIGLNFIWQEKKLSCEPRDTLINPCSHITDNGQRFYAYPPNFTQFIQCNDDLDPLVYKCPRGLMWNDCIKTCTYRNTITNNCFIDPHGPLASYIGMYKPPP